MIQALPPVTPVIIIEISVSAPPSDVCTARGIDPRHCKKQPSKKPPKSISQRKEPPHRGDGRRELMFAINGKTLIVNM